MVFGIIRGEEQFIDAILTIDVLEGLKIPPVCSKSPIFVFNLEGDNGAAMAGRERFYLLQQDMKKALNLFQIRRIKAAQFHVFVREEPGGKTAKIQFRADIGTRPKDNLQSESMGCFNILDNIQTTLEIIHTLFWFVQFPGYIGFQSV